MRNFDAAVGVFTCTSSGGFSHDIGSATTGITSCYREYYYRYQYFLYHLGFRTDKRQAKDKTR